MAITNIDNLHELYGDAQRCAQLVGLEYIDAEAPGLTRIKRGKGFAYRDTRNRAASAAVQKRIAELIIPPAWKAVWICPSTKGHVLATGIDEKGRKQYIYHPKWRTMRDLIKFYRLITFARILPQIRRTIDTHLRQRKFTRAKVIAIMLWILDNTYIRVGNDTYFQLNESVGLTTLTDRNVVIAGPVITLAFKGKSGKDQQITLEHADIAKGLDELRRVKGARLFRYQDAASDWHAIDANDINNYLHELTGVQISTKDFRTWGGTSVAFMHLIEEDEASRKKPEKVIVEAVDDAAAVLGNTRAIARSSYVHPHILAVYGSRHFGRYYKAAAKQRKLPGLDKHESELLYFLEQLFQREFDLLKTKTHLQNRD